MRVLGYRGQGHTETTRKQRGIENGNNTGSTVEVATWKRCTSGKISQRRRNHAGLRREWRGKGLRPRTVSSHSSGSIPWALKDPLRAAPPGCRIKNGWGTARETASDGGATPGHGARTAVHRCARAAPGPPETRGRPPPTAGRDHLTTSHVPSGSRSTRRQTCLRVRAPLQSHRSGPAARSPPRRPPATPPRPPPAARPATSDRRPANSHDRAGWRQRVVI